MSQTIDSANRTDVELQVHPQPPIFSPKTPAWALRGTQIEDLGRKTTSRLDVKGIRETQRSPSQLSLAEEPSQSSVESWYANDLHLIVAERRTNPLGAVVAINLFEIERNEPPASLFKVPKGYWVIRPKRQRFTSHMGGGQAWAITPLDFDPNDVFGVSDYPSGFVGFSFPPSPR